MPAITPLPESPSRSDSAPIFVSKADALMAALPPMVNQINETVAGLPGVTVTATSTTSLTIGAGSKSITVETGLGIIVGMSLKIASVASPTNWLHGDVTSYNSGTGALVVNVTTMQGVGTFASWRATLSAPAGPAAVPQGGEAVSSALDITLDSASARVQSVTMTTSSKAIILPDPATLSEGGPIFIIHKASGYAFDIKNSAGTVVGRISSARYALMMLIDSAANLWKVAYCDTSLSVGLASIFNAASTSGTALCALDSSRAIVAYRDNGNSSYLTACVLTVSGTTVSAGAEYVVLSGNSSYTASLVTIDSSKALIAFSDPLNGGFGTALILSVSGTSISVGAKTAFNAVNSSNLTACKLDATHALVCYADVPATNAGKSCVLTISGTSVSAGAIATFNSGASDYVSVCALDSTHAVVAYQDLGNSSYGTACVLAVSGTTITPGAESVFRSATCAYTNIVNLSSSQALVTYTDGGTLNPAASCVLNVSGSAITPQTPSTFYSSNCWRVISAVIDEQNVLVGLIDSATGYEYALVLNINGNSSFVGIGPTLARGSGLNHSAICHLGNGKGVIAIQDTGNSSYGTAISVAI